MRDACIDLRKTGAHGLDRFEFAIAGRREFLLLPRRERRRGPGPSITEDLIGDDDHASADRFRFDLIALDDQRTDCPSVESSAERMVGFDGIDAADFDGGVVVELIEAVVVFLVNIRWKMRFFALGPRVISIGRRSADLEIERIFWLAAGEGRDCEGEKEAVEARHRIR